MKTRRKPEIAGFYFHQVIILSRRVAGDKQATCKSPDAANASRKESAKQDVVGQERIVEEELSTSLPPSFHHPSFLNAENKPENDPSTIRLHLNSFLVKKKIFMERGQEQCDATID